VGSNHARLEYAITHFSHCIESVLKARLRLADPESVWHKAGKKPAQGRKTVTAATAITRLKDIGVIFSASDEANLRLLRDARNKIEHYEWYATKKEARVIIFERPELCNFIRKRRTWYRLGRGAQARRHLADVD